MSNRLSFYKKIADVQKNVTRIPKNGWNDYHKYHFVREADLLDYGRNLLLENGLILLTNVLDSERVNHLARVKMEFLLVDVDTAEEYRSVYWGEGQDTGDKAIYKAYTGAVKYFFMKTFLISSGDDAEYEPMKADDKKQSHPRQSEEPMKADDKKQSHSRQSEERTERTHEQKMFDNLKREWAANAGNLQGFSQWYAERQKSGMTNEAIYNLFKNKITKKAAAGE